MKGFQQAPKMGLRWNNRMFMKRQPLSEEQVD